MVSLLVFYTITYPIAKFKRRIYVYCQKLLATEKGLKKVQNRLPLVAAAICSDCTFVSRASCNTFGRLTKALSTADSMSKSLRMPAGLISFNALGAGSDSPSRRAAAIESNNASPNFRLPLRSQGISLVFYEYFTELLALDENEC